MKKINSKILLALLLTFAMLLSMATVTAFAAGGTTVFLAPDDTHKPCIKMNSETIKKAVFKIKI